MDIYVLRDGDVCTPEGYDARLSLASVTVVLGCAASVRARTRRTIERFINVRLPGDGTVGTILEDDLPTAIRRVRAYAQTRGLRCVPTTNAIDVNGWEVTRPNGPVNHEAEGLAVIRKLYRVLRTNGDLTFQNPMDVDGWEDMAATEREAWWRARHPRSEYAHRHAGARFHVCRRTSYPPMLHDPENAGPEMTAALRALPAPETLCDAAEIMEVNGQRYGDLVPANAYGWALAGFGTHYMGRNKGDGAALVKPIMIPPGPLERLIGRFRDAPHPHDPTRSRMDHLRELALHDQREMLSDIPLFPNRSGRPFAYSTFNGWFRRAMEEAGVVLPSSFGFKRPTSSWYRHAIFCSELAEIYETSTSEEEIKRRKQDLATRLGQSTDQSQRYAPAVVAQHAIKLQIQRAEERRNAAADLRSGVPLPPALDRLKDPDAEAAWNSLPRGAR